MAALGLTTEDTFTLITTATDAQGVHARLQQLHDGVEVQEAQVIAHTDLNGRYLPYTNGALTGIRTSPKPAISASAAITTVQSDPRTFQPFLAPPSATLIYWPQYAYVLANGSAPPPTQYDQHNEFSLVESTNALDVHRVTTAVKLAWRVTTLEQDRNGVYYPRAWVVDANANAVLEIGELSNSIGPGGVASGLGLKNGSVSISAAHVSSCYSLQDIVRNYSVQTEDFSSNDVVNCDSDDSWGDGLAFVGNGNSPSTKNWQTDMVDVHYGAMVYWNLAYNVFGISGPDNNFYSVNAFVHAGSNWDLADYNGISGNIAFGDSPTERLTDLATVGHEQGHAWRDFHVGSIVQTKPLDEHHSDISGIWTEIYAKSGMYSASAVTVGDESYSSWKVPSSSISMLNPGAKGKSNYWYPDLYNEEVHDADLPADRAWAFLAHGASARITSPNFSRKIPWGMVKISTLRAATIFYKAWDVFFINWDYQSLRQSMLDSVNSLFPGATPLSDAVKNAYAAINVGAPAPSMPASPPLQAGVEPNNTSAQAQSLTFTLPPSGAVAGAPQKAILIGQNFGGVDVFRVKAPGSELDVLVTPLITISPLNGTYSVTVTDEANHALPNCSVNITPKPTMLVCKGLKPLTTFFIVVKQSGTGQPTAYEMDVDGVTP